MEDLKVGDVVQIITKNGPAMTVNEISTQDDEIVECLWFEKTRLHRDWFNKGSIVKLKKDELLF